MARTTSRSTDRACGRAVQRRRTNWTYPLIISLLAVLVLGTLLWQWQQGASQTGAAQPIATLPTQDYHALVWSPTEPNTVFFGHHGGLMKSTDGGRTWQSTTLTNADAMSITTAPKAPERIYAAGHGIFRRSDDGGTTWTAPETTIQGVDIHGFAQSPADPDQLYALVVGQGILKSTDGGATWTRANVMADEMHAALAVSTDGKALLRGTANGVQQSTDDGATWTPFGKGLPRRAQVLALAVHPSGDTILAATSEGLYRWSRASDTWTPTELAGTILAVASSPAQPNTILAVDDQGRVYRSDDGGATW